MAKMKSLTGFTLLELIITILIIGILATTGIAYYSSALEKARSAEAVSVLNVLRSAQMRYKAEYGSYTASLANLDALFTGLKFFEGPSLGNGTLYLGEMQRDSTKSWNSSLGTVYKIRIKTDGSLTCLNNKNVCDSLGITYE